MRFIVTGGAGFVGSHLVQALLDDGHRVIVLDNFSAGSMENLPKHPKLKVVDFDIRFWRNFENHIDLFNRVEGIYHLAANARIQPSITDPVSTMDNNVTGTQNILQAMRLFVVKNLVYSASSSSYGLKNQSPLVETMEPECLNPYAVSKYIGELLCSTWGRIYNLRTCSLKYFNVYGPRSPIHIGAYSPVIGLFFQQALNGEPLTVIGDGEQKRDFTYVSDVVRANMLAMKNLRGSGKANGLTINIGTGANYTINEVAEKIRDILSEVSDVKIQHVGARKGESRETLADISRAWKLLAWKPRVDLDEALEELKPYYMQIVQKCA